MSDRLTDPTVTGASAPSPPTVPLTAADSPDDARVGPAAVSGDGIVAPGGDEISPRGSSGAPLTQWTAQRLRRNIRQFVKFGLVGASGVVVNLVVFTVTLLVWLLASGHIHSLGDLGGAVHDLATRRDTTGVGHAAVFLANGIGFVVSVLTNYYLNRRWTFRSQHDVAGELSKFVLVSVVAYGGQLAVFWLFHTRVHVPPIPSQLIAIACVMPINFVFNKLWSFR